MFWLNWRQFLLPISAVCISRASNFLAFASVVWQRKAFPEWPFSPSCSLCSFCRRRHCVIMRGNDGRLTRLLKNKTLLHRACVWIPLNRYPESPALKLTHLFAFLLHILSEDFVQFYCFLNPPWHPTAEAVVFMDTVLLHESSRRPMSVFCASVPGLEFIVCDRWHFSHDNFALFSLKAALFHHGVRCCYWIETFIVKLYND